MKKTFNIGSKRKSVQEKKNKYDSKSIVRIVVSLLVAILAFAGTVSFESYLLSDKSTATVVVAKEPVTYGTVINEKNRDQYFETISVNSALKTENTLTDISDVHGKTLVSLEAGQIVTKNQLSDTTVVIDNMKNPVEFTFSISNMANGVAGTIRAGDICDVLIVTKGTMGIVESSKTIMENVYILATYDESGVEIASNDTTAKSMTFKIYIDKNDEATFNHLLTENNVTVTKIAHYNDIKALKQSSNFDGVSTTSVQTEPVEDETLQDAQEDASKTWVEKDVEDNQN